MREFNTYAEELISDFRVIYHVGFMDKNMSDDERLILIQQLSNYPESCYMSAKLDTNRPFSYLEMVTIQALTTNLRAQGVKSSSIDKIIKSMKPAWELKHKTQLSKGSELYKMSKSKMDKILGINPDGSVK